MAVERTTATNGDSASAAAVHDASAKAASAMSQQSSAAAEHGSAMTSTHTSSRDEQLRKPLPLDGHESARDDSASEAAAQSQKKIAGNLDLQVAVGDFLETIEVQLAIVLLVVFDVCCTALEIHLRDRQDVARLQTIIDASDSTSSAVLQDQGSVLLTVATRLVESFTGFTIFFFLLEMAVLAAAFRRLFFAHLGYVLDLVIIVGAISYEIYSQSKALRLLGVLRIWRVFRLVNTLLERERSAHDSTRDALEQEQLRALHLATEKLAAQQSLKREYESRDGLEKLLQGYKDEVDTLKEALNIAAEAVAEANLRDETASHEQQMGLALVAETEASGEAYEVYGAEETEIPAAAAATEYSDEASYAYYYGYDQHEAPDYGIYAQDAAEQHEESGNELVSDEPLEFDEQRDAETTELVSAARHVEPDAQTAAKDEEDAAFEDAVEQ